MDYLPSSLPSNTVCDGGVWSCAGRCGQFRFPCSCHPLCSVYSTCCLDYSDVCSTEAETTTVPIPQLIAKVNTDSRNNSDENTLQKGKDELRQSPVASCAGRALARLVRNCPKGTAEQMNEQCLENIHPSSLSHLIPVTDAVTGIHFANIHCYSCWKNYMQPGSFGNRPCSGDCHNLTDKDHASVLRWQVTITKQAGKKPHDENSLTSVNHFLTSWKTAYLWKSPDGHPYHPCVPIGGYHISQCLDCSRGCSSDSCRITHLCEKYISFVTYNLHVSYSFANKYCLYCELASKIYNEHLGLINKSFSVTDAIASAIQTAQCGIPNDTSVFDDSHMITGNDMTGNDILVQWVSSKSVWLLDNVKSAFKTELRETDFTEVFINWKHLECSETSCQPVLCTFHSTLHNGRCDGDILPFTSVIKLCLTTTPHDTECVTDLQELLSSPGNHSRVLTQMEEVVKEVLLAGVPWRFESGLEQVSNRVSGQHGVIVTVWSATIHEAPQTPAVQMSDHKDLDNEVKRGLQRLGLVGWVRICHHSRFYRVADSAWDGEPCLPASGHLVSISGTSGVHAIACPPGVLLALLVTLLL